MKRVIIIAMSTFTLGQAMEKIWHHDVAYVSRDGRLVLTVAKGAATEKTAEVDKEKRSVGMSAPVFLKAFDSAFPSRYDSYASFLMDLEREKKIENERIRVFEKQICLKRAAILQTTKEREQASQRPFGSFENTRRTAAVIIFMQLAAVPLLTTTKLSGLVPAVQSSLNVEKIDVQKIAPLPIKRVPALQYNKFLPKNEKRFSKKRSHHIQQPCNR